MPDDNDERIAAVAQELQKPNKQPLTAGEKGRPKRARVHRSIYLEQSIYNRLGEAYKMTNHELYPLEVRKSTFIEACIAYALDHLPDIKTILHKER